MDEIAKNPGIVSPDVDLRLNKPELRIEVERDKAADLRRERRGGGQGDRDPAGRAQRDALQARRRAVRRDRADPGQRPHHARRHRPHLCARPQRRDDSAVGAGQGARKRLARASSTTSASGARCRSPPACRPTIRWARRSPSWTRPPPRCSRPATAPTSTAPRASSATRRARWPLCSCWRCCLFSWCWPRSLKALSTRW